MLRRTIILGVTVLTLVAAPVFSAEAEKKSARDTSTTSASKTKSRTTAKTEPASVPTFTNADIEALPSDGNSTLPSLEGDADTPGANRFTIIGTPAPEGAEANPAPAVDPAAAEASMQWVERMLAQRQRAADIAAAQRRVRQAEARVTEIERTYRPKGSAFSEGGGNTDRLFVRGVTSTSGKYDDAIRKAYLEAAEARAALDALLAERAAAATPKMGGNS